MRLFVAAYPPVDVLDHLEARVAGLRMARAGARVSARARWHVTLAFIGEADGAEAAAAALDRAAAALGAARPSLRFAGGGRFGRGRFTTVWAGVGGDVAVLRRYAQVVRRELRAARVPYDGKAFRPHLTLGRPGDRLGAEAIAEDLATLDAYRGPEWTVTALHLVESHQGPHPTHETIHTAPLPR